MAMGCLGPLPHVVNQRLTHHALSRTVVPHICHMLCQTRHQIPMLYELVLRSTLFCVGSGVDGLAPSRVFQIMESRSMTLAMPHHQVVVTISVDILIVWSAHGKPSPGRISPRSESDVAQGSSYHTHVCRHAFHATYPHPKISGVFES